LNTSMKTLTSVVDAGAPPDCVTPAFTSTTKKPRSLIGTDGCRKRHCSSRY
jgi:hypothetical protein